MDVIEKDQFLKIFPFFSNGPRILVENILSSSRYKNIPGKMLVKLEGDQCQDFIFMLSGEKRIFKMSESGREITLYEITAGDICVLNASCILSNTRLPANAATMSETSVLLLPAQNFLNMIAIHEEMRAFVHSRINESLASIMILVSEIVFGKLDERLISYLVEKSENGTLRRTHQKIAYDLGTSREVVSRLLKDFERQDRIFCSRNLIQIYNL
jgi:CRP/FNR family transcriptional regulator